MLTKEYVDKALENNIITLRFHGRGGQGGVTGANLCVEAFRGYGVSQPRFGAERMGSPTESYVRLSRNIELVRSNEQVCCPHFVLVLDVSLLSEKDIVAGIPSGGWLIVNTSMNQLTIQDVVKRNDINIATIDATRIALDILGRNITNTIILGALVRISYLFTLEELSDAIMARFKGEVAAKNIKAVKQAIEETCAYECGIDVDFSYYNKLLWSQVELHLPGYKDLDKAGVWYLNIDKNLIRVGSDQVNTGVWGEFDIIWDSQVCTNCSQCWFICPDFAIMRNLGDDGLWHMIGIDVYHCKSCQNCVNICPVQAISKKQRQEPFSCAAPP